MPIKNVAIFANPIAGRGKGKVLARHLAKSLEAAGVGAHRVAVAPAVATADDLSAMDAIIAIGGDGTLRAVAGRCLEILGRIPPLLPVPMGTANLMSQHLGIAWDRSNMVQGIVHSIRRAKICNLDAALANGQLFLLMVGVGIDAMIVHELDRVRTGPINYASYVLPAALAMATYQFTPIEVSIDGELRFKSAPAMAFIANVPEYGVGFPLVPDARPDDGLLDVCVIPIGSKFDAVHQLLRAAAGEHTLGEGVLNARGKRIDIRSATPMPIQIDGDPAGHTPVHIEMLEKPVPFIEPV